MACLVTGGTGYVGSYVVRDLIKEGKEVICLQRSGITSVAQEIIGEDKLSQVKIVQGDVSNTLQLFEVIKEYGVDLIFHIGYSIPPGSEQQPANAVRVNCIGTNNVLEAVRLFGLKRMVWTSSGRALGTVGKFFQAPIGGDDAIYMPDSMYGATKVLNEFMAKLYFEKFGVDSIGIRMPLVYGVGRYHGSIGVFTEFLRKAALNLPITLADDDSYRSSGYLYIEDAAAAIVRAGNVSATRSRLFNVSEGNYTSRQMADTILKVNPQAKVIFEEGTGGLIPPMLDTSGARTELGWQPEYTLEAGLKKVFNYFREKEGMPLL